MSTGKRTEGPRMKSIPGFLEWFSANQRGRSAQEMADLVRERYGVEWTAKQVKAFRNNNKLNSGRTGWFAKGHEPVNKGGSIMPTSPAKLARMKASWFRKGEMPHNHMPVGMVTPKSEGYMWIKVAEPNKWESLQRWVWRKAGRDIPEGMVVTFLDGDKLNFRLDNLSLISNEENLAMNRDKLRFGSGALGQLGLDLARLSIAIGGRR